MPLYLAVGGGNPGMYYNTESSKWILTVKFTEENARRFAANSTIVAEDRALRGRAALPLLRRG